MPRVVTDCGLLVGGVLLILGVALGFTQYLVDAQVPEQAVTWATSTIHSRWLFLLGLNVVLILVGGLVEIYAAIVVVVPLLVPLGLAFGIDPIHLGIIFLVNMELGFLAPPVGLESVAGVLPFQQTDGRSDARRAADVGRVVSRGVADHLHPGVDDVAAAPVRALRCTILPASSSTWTACSVTPKLSWLRPRAGCSLNSTALPYKPLILPHFPAPAKTGTSAASRPNTA